MLNFTRPGENQFKYFLDGYESDWILANPKENTISYTNLPPGTYTFRVKGITFSRTSGPEDSLTIIIYPPWFWNIYSQILYVLLAILILVWLFRRQLRRQLTIQENKQLKEIDQFKNQFFENITHEFRTPLTIINGIAVELKDNEEGKRLIKRNSNILLQLINRILTLSKLQAKSVKLQLSQSDIIFYLKYLTQSFQSYAVSKNISLSFMSVEEELLMDFDKEYLRQILSNLISNAVKFTPQYGQIQVKAFRNNNELQISIQDTGIGIPESDLPFIFDRFYQLKNTGKQGTGIGLSIVNELVKLMRGKISVASIINQGTTFIIQLPVQNKAPLDQFDGQEIEDTIPFFEPISTNDFEKSRQGVHSNLPNVLVVEDNPDLLSYLTTILRSSFQLTIATNGAEGIRLALKLIPDIIISDVMMPEKDGFELSSTLKNDFKTSHIPIILLTAKAGQDSKKEGLQTGADVYLAKPFDKEELFIHINNQLELRRSLKEKYSKLDIQALSKDITANNKDVQFLLKLEKVVRDNLSDESFRVEPNLCKAMLMSRPQLYRKLQALKGISPSEYIKKARLSYSRKLLLESDLTIAEIADQSGFKSPAYFSKAYKDEYKETPTETRNGLQ